MTVDQVPAPGTTRAGGVGDVVLDGVLTGMIGALTVAAWFLVRDVLAGRPLYTPAVLGNVLLHGRAAASTPVAIAPLELAAYTAFHFVAFMVVGFVFSWLMNLFERFPIMFFVILMLFLALQLGFFVLNAALGTELLGLIEAWAVAVANVLAAGAMAWFQWTRHPRALRGVERLWHHEA